MRPRNPSATLRRALPLLLAIPAHALFTPLRSGANLCCAAPAPPLPPSHAGATYYGLDGWSIHKGACGLGYQYKNQGTGWDVAAIADASPEFAGSCGWVVKGWGGLRFGWGGRRVGFAVWPLPRIPASALPNMSCWTQPPALTPHATHSFSPTPLPFNPRRTLQALLRGAVRPALRGHRRLRQLVRPLRGVQAPGRHCRRPHRGQL